MRTSRSTGSVVANDDGVRRSHGYLRGPPTGDPIAKTADKFGFAMPTASAAGRR